MKQLTLKGRILQLYECLLLVYLYVRMVSYFTEGNTYESILLVCRILLIAFAMFALVRLRSVRVTGVMILALVTAMYFFATGLQTYQTATDIVINLTVQGWWSISFILFSVLMSGIGDTEKEKAIRILIIAFYVFAVRYAVWLFSSEKYWSAGAINSIYYCILFLPLSYLTNSRTVRYSMLFLAGLLTVVSGKRAALIAIILCAFFPLLMEKGRRRSRKKTGAIFLVALVCIALVCMSEYLSKFMDINILDRMKSLEEDGGSGRTTIYAATWNAFDESATFLKLFGHGFNAVYANGVVTSSAHSDFLEVLYDYGIFGAALYLSFVILLVGGGLRLRRQRSAVFPAYAAALLMFITLSGVSHLIIYPTYIVFLLYIFGLGFSDIIPVRQRHIYIEKSAGVLAE